MITLDITTKNSVYNPLSAQGQWIQHRFGKRDYPDLDLDLNTIKKTLDTYNQIFFRSVYGDPLCHPHIGDILSLIKDSNKNCIIFTYLNIDDDNLMQQILEVPNLTLYVMIDGFESYSKTFLNSDPKTVFKNIQYLGKKAVLEFYMYRHNILEVEKIKQQFPNNEISLTPGRKLTEDSASILDEKGHWLYDVYSVSEYDINLYDSSLNKSLNNFKTLIVFLKDVNGESFLNEPVVARHIKDDITFEIDMPAISVTGHLFDSTEIMTIFSNALCCDWYIRDLNDISYVSKLVISKNKSFAERDNYAIRVNTALIGIREKGLKRFCDSDV